MLDGDEHGTSLASTTHVAIITKIIIKNQNVRTLVSNFTEYYYKTKYFDFY